MRRLGILLAALGILLSTATAHAADKTKNNLIGVRLGYLTYTANNSDGPHSSFDGGIFQLDYERMLEINLGLAAGLSYISESKGHEEFSTTELFIRAYYHTNDSDNFHIYAGGGLGYYLSEYKVTAGDGSTALIKGDGDKAGLDLVVGALLPITDHLGVSGELKWGYVKDLELDFGGPLKSDIDVTNFVMLVGLALDF